MLEQLGRASHERRVAESTRGGPRAGRTRSRRRTGGAGEWRSRRVRPGSPVARRTAGRWSRDSATRRRTRVSAPGRPWFASPSRPTRRRPSVSMDSRTKVVQVRSPVSAAEWPSPGSNNRRPPSDRRSQDAPAEIANLPPLPSCGETEFDQPADRHACFPRNAVLGGTGRAARACLNNRRCPGRVAGPLGRARCGAPLLDGVPDLVADGRRADPARQGRGSSFDPRTDTRTVLPG